MCRDYLFRINFFTIYREIITAIPHIATIILNNSTLPIFSLRKIYPRIIPKIGALLPKIVVREPVVYSKETNHIIFDKNNNITVIKKSLYNLKSSIILFFY